MFLCILGFLAGIVIFFYGFRLLQRRRLILDTPFSKIRSASMGMVEVSGLAVGPYTMIAPVTAHPCYYYRTLVWEYKQNGKNKEWVRIAGECMHVPFFVDDNTGRVLVDPRSADLDLHRDFREEFNGSFFSTSDNAPASVNSFLARHGIMTSNKIKVEEFCIKPKNSLFILGTLGDNPGIEVAPKPVSDADAIGSMSTTGFSLSVNSLALSAAAGVADSLVGSMFQGLTTETEVSTTEPIRVLPKPGTAKPVDDAQQKKIATALMKAGISNPTAWAAAGVTIPGIAPPGLQVVADPSAANGFDLHPPVALMKGTNNKTFLISWRSQQEIARSLGWKCILMIWGGPALALLSLYYFVGVKHLF